MEDFTELPSYKKLASYYQNTAKNIDLCEEFSKDSERQATFCRKNTFETESGNIAKIIFDFSKNLIDKESFSLLLEFAQEAKLLENIEFFFSGLINKNIEYTESYKKKKQDDFKYKTKLNISTIWENMKNYSEDIRSQRRKSIFGTAFSSIVIIGIQSSNVNFEVVSDAFSNIATTPILYFVSNTIGSRIEDILQTIDFKTTLFIISSKTFTDKGTILSSEIAKKFITESILNRNSNYDPYYPIKLESYMESHFVAISNNRKLVKDFGIRNRFDFCDWIDDGVCSLWSEMILPMSINIGFDDYYTFLEGCYSMDMHFRYTPIEDNLPVIMALVDFWYENFWRAKAFPILPYDQRLAIIAAIYQRSDTESMKNNPISGGFDLEHQLGPSIWNEYGDTSRYMLYQLIHQGKKIIPCDLIALVKNQRSDSNILHEKLALSNFFALSEALMNGISHFKTLSNDTLNSSSKFSGQVDNISVNKAYAGNKPSSSIMIASDIDTFTLGLLVALYEHRRSIRGILDNDNTLNYKDIKLVKCLAKNILTELNIDVKVDTHDKSTNELINFYKNNTEIRIIRLKVYGSLLISQYFIVFNKRFKDSSKDKFLPSYSGKLATSEATQLVRSADAKKSVFTFRWVGRSSELAASELHLLPEKRSRLKYSTVAKTDPLYNSQKFTEVSVMHLLNDSKPKALKKACYGGSDKKLDASGLNSPKH
ncbi:hypothetical protein BB561_001671 [Smittium simulii]|uniref:Glucose-6-phosphate isomerase n=1 Tax=Smittium simulii TaxID=133385 RepID=A0A2T9YTI3_9FUNG|nr:hypothetical protein BB561_001671 [Smittium simulii]